MFYIVIYSHVYTIFFSGSVCRDGPVLIVSGVGPGVVRYFLDGRDPGAWSGGATALLGLSGNPGRVELRRVLQGRDPMTGLHLTEHPGRRRRAGWDLVFSAPKSLSLVVSRATPLSAQTLHEAHTTAVEDVMRHLEGRLLLHRRSDDGGFLRADGLIAATFRHSQNGAAEPHLHSHVLIVNLSRSGDTWGCVRGSEWFVDRTALAALYHLGLRHHLTQRGWTLDWHLRPDGLADLAEVPTAAVRAASTRSRLAVSTGRFAAPSTGRRDQDPAAPGGGGWVGDPVLLPGSGIGLMPGTRPGPGPDLERRVALRLSTRRSDFRLADVVMAMASSCPAGLRAQDALA